jgi:chitin synthase
MDEDQSARRVAQKYLKVVDADYYEFESKFDSKTELCFLMWIKILLLAYH